MSTNVMKNFYLHTASASAMVPLAENLLLKQRITELWKQFGEDQKTIQSLLFATETCTNCKAPLPENKICLVCKTDNTKKKVDTGFKEGYVDPYT